MSGEDSRRNIWRVQKRGHKVIKPVDEEKNGLLYMRMNRKTGRMETNILEWERKWKYVKITEYPAEYADQLRTGVRVAHDRATILAPFNLEPEKDTAFEHWVPTAAQTTELAAIRNEAQHDRREKELFLEWRGERLTENAMIRTQNEIKKAERDLKIKEMDQRKSTVLNLIGTILGDMTKDSRLKVEEYVHQLEEDEVQANNEAVNIEEARVRLDWLFIFQAARNTHLLYGVQGNALLMLEQREQQKAILSKLKHVSGDFYRWLQRFEDQCEICMTVGVDLTDVSRLCTSCLHHLQEHPRPLA